MPANRLSTGKILAGALSLNGPLTLTTTHSGLLFGAGASGANHALGTTADNALEFYLSATHTTGDMRGMYLRLYFAGAGGSGEALRAFSTVDDVAAATVHGAHLSLNFDSTANSGRVTGLGVASRNTLHIPNDATWTSGTLAATQAEIYSDGANSDSDGLTELSFLRIVNDGNASGIADIDDDAFLFVLTGGASATGNVFYNSFRVKAHGTTYYLPVSTAENALTLPTGVIATLQTAHSGLLLGAGASGANHALGATADNALEFYLNATHTTGDMRGEYLRLYFSGAGGSGETSRIFSTINNVSVATGGTVNGAHISLGTAGASAAVSGAANALRATFGIAAASTNIGGTCSVIQVDTDFDTAVTVPTNFAFLRFTNTNTKKSNNLMRVPDVLAEAGGLFCIHTVQTMTHSLRIVSADGTAYYVMCADTNTNRTES